MELLKLLDTETLKKMLLEIKDDFALAFIRAELLRREKLNKS